MNNLPSPPYLYLDALLFVLIKSVYHSLCTLEKVRKGQSIVNRGQNIVNQEINFKTRSESLHSENSWVRENFVCTSCGWAFKCQQSLKTHVAIHTESYKRCYDVCDLNFVQIVAYKNQIWMWKAHLVGDHKFEEITFKIFKILDSVPEKNIFGCTDFYHFILLKQIPRKWAVIKADHRLSPLLSEWSQTLRYTEDNEYLPVQHTE